jgi:hypothetical protein
MCRNDQEKAAAAMELRFSLYGQHIRNLLISEQLLCPCPGTKMDDNGAGLVSVAYRRYLMDQGDLSRIFIGRPFEV